MRVIVLITVAYRKFGLMFLIVQCLYVIMEIDSLGSYKSPGGRTVDVFVAKGKN